MKKWEYRMKVHYMDKKRDTGIYNIPSIWESKNEDGTTTWHGIIEAGKEGWELISCVPLAGVVNGETCAFLFIFKRPLEEDDSIKEK